MRSRQITMAICCALLAAAFFASAWVLSRDGAGTQAVVMAVGAIAFITLAIVSALTVTRSRPRRE